MLKSQEFIFISWVIIKPFRKKKKQSGVTELIIFLEGQI